MPAPTTVMTLVVLLGLDLALLADPPRVPQTAADIEAYRHGWYYRGGGTLLPRPRLSMLTKERSALVRLGVTVEATVTIALAGTTLAEAQGQRNGPKVNVGGKMVDPPDMHQFDAYMERGPDGAMRLEPGANVKVGVVGPDGKRVKNADGTDKMVPLNNPFGTQPLEPGSPEHNAMLAKAAANPGAGSEGVTADGTRPGRGNLPEAVGR